jgi:hypothetical protein
MIDGRISEPEGVVPVLRMGRFGMDGLDAHDPHQTLNAYTVDLMALSPEMPYH